MYNYNGPHRLGITDAGVAHFDGYALLHAGNYTSYVNTTNFPGLNKVGTVTSVAMTVPTGLSVSGTPITTSGTLAISFASGYSIPTTAKQSNWDTAYGWGNHASAGYLLASTAASTYLRLTGGTMTGTIQVGEYTAFGVSGSTFYLGSPAYPVNLQSNGTTQINGNTIWHSGNSNKSDVAWACSTLTAAGNISTSGYVSVGIGGANSYVGSDAANNIFLHNSSGYILVVDGVYVRRGSSASTATLGSTTYPWAGITATSADFRLTNFTDFHIYRNNSAGSAGITYYASAQTTNYWNAGMDPTGTAYGGRFYWYYTGSYLAYLTTTGNFVAVGAITAGAASDARLKTNIRALSADAAKRIVMGLNPVTFTWNARATELYDRYKGDDLGMIAQEVEPYLPQAIGTIFENYKRLDYDKVVTPLVKVAQDHETRLARAEGRIAALERENAELKRKLFAC